MKEVPLPFRSGFYLTAHSLVTQEGGCMPMLGRTRDKCMYVLTAEPVDGEYILLEDDVAMMKNEEIPNALKEGSMGYYTMAQVDLIPYHIFNQWEKRDYMLFAVRVNDLVYDTKTKKTLISTDRKLYYMDSHFTGDVAVPPPAPSRGERSDDIALGVELKIVSSSILMQQKRNEVANGVECTYDTKRANKIMKAAKRGK